MLDLASIQIDPIPDTPMLLRAALATVIAYAALPLAAQENAPGGRPLPGELDGRCISAEDIVGYRTVSDELIRFELKDHDVMARLRKSCPQLHFHGYISYRPVNGLLCAKFDDVVSRSGMPCRIDSFTPVDHTPGDEQGQEEEGQQAAPRP